MRTCLAVLFAMFFAPLLALTQETPKVDIFAGYSLVHFDDQGFQDRLNAAFPACCSYSKFLNGWEGTVQYNFNQRFGVIADFSGNYGSPITVHGGGSVNAAMYNVLFGPQVNFRSRKVNVFAHTMIGLNRIRIDQLPAPISTPTFTQNSFAWAIGAGVDVKASRLLSVRVGQLDYLLTTQNFNLGFPGSGGHQNNLRYSAGIVFHLGSK